MSYIAILHGNEDEPHEPIVTTVLGGAYVERDLGIFMADPCPTCQRLQRQVWRKGRYEIVETREAPEPFKGTLICRLVEVTEQACW